jgi:ubiquinone/menaquinone biosynthesis C-methylase UbiE
MTPNMAANSESSVASLYSNEAVAATYIQTRFSSPWGKLLHTSQVRQINHVIRDHQPHTIIEIAPGPARIAVDLTGVRHGLMLDSSEEMLKLAKHRLSSAGMESLWELHQHNAFDLESLHLQCDLLYSFRFIRHFDTSERARLYQAIYGSLMPRGLFMLDVVNRHVRQRLDLKYGLPSEHGLKVFDATYSPEEFRHELTPYGFEVLSLTPVLRCFEIQSRISYMMDHYLPTFANLIVRMLERVPLQHPLEWVALCQKLS